MNETWEQATSAPREAPVAFSEDELATLRAAVDEIIPASGDGFPSAGEAGVPAFIARHLPPREDETFRMALHAIDMAAGESLASATPPTRVAALRHVEQEQPDFFTSLLRITYYGYYSRPVVVEAIRTILGYDYNDHPQPYGYRLPAFDPQDPHHSPAVPRGRYVPTESVRRIYVND